MKITQPELQTPFLQPDLLTVSSFTSYCRDNGILTDERELEYFDKERLLIPAARVLMGVVEYKRIYADFDGTKEWRYVFADDLDKFEVKKLDPKTYYDQGALVQSMPGLGNVRGFHFGNDGWMDWYSERNMVTYPAKEGYLPWSKLRNPDAPSGQMFGDDPKLYEEVSQLMYAKHQIYLLKLIQNRRTIKVKNEGLFRTPESWLEAGNMITKLYSESESNERIQKMVSDWNHFFSFLMEVRRLRLGKHAYINKVIEDEYKTYKDIQENPEEAEADARSAGAVYDSNITADAKKLPLKYSLKIEDIEHWRYRLLEHGSFGVGSRSRQLRPYVTLVSNQLLAKTEDAYRLVNELCWFIELIGGRSLTAKELILNSMGETCRFCGKSFESSRRTQVTCGDPVCKAKLQNEHKKKMRQIGKYKDTRRPQKTR